MPTKRTLLVTAVLALLVATSGCSALQGGPAETPAAQSQNVDAEQILDRTQAGVADLETFTFDARMSMEWPRTNQTRTMTATGAVDIPASEVRVAIDAPTSSITMYLVNETMYMKLRGAWVKQSLANATATAGAQPTPAPRSDRFLNATSVSFVGNTSINGTEVYELSVDVNESLMQNALQQQNGSLGSLVSIENVSYTLYVTHDEYRLKRLTANMTMTQMGRTVDADLQVTLDDFNETVSIDLPAAAKNARQLG